MCCQHQLVLFIGCLAATGAAAKGPVWEDDSVALIQKAATELVVAPGREEVTATEWRGKIRIRSNDKCMDMNTDENKNLYMGNCHTGLNQIFELHDDKHIITLFDDRCIDSNTDTRNLYIANCHSGGNQKFYFDGEQVKNEHDGNGKCMDDAGDNVYMGDCHSSDNQKFYIEFVETFAPTVAPTSVPPEEIQKSDTEAGTGFDTSNSIASAAGDPHLTNLVGERFDLNTEGPHIMIQIPRGSGAQLEVVGSVERLPIERLGESPCDQFFFKKFTVRGTWVGTEVSVAAGKGGELEGFGVTHGHGGETSWMSYDSLIQRSDPATSGEAQMWGCKVTDSVEQRQLCKELGSLEGGGNRQLRVLTRKPNTLMMTMPGSGSMPVHLAFSRFEVASPAYLNLGLIGISGSLDVGGLLGSDDHSEVSIPSPGCTKKHHAKVRPQGYHADRTKRVNNVRLNRTAAVNQSRHVHAKVNHSLAREMHHTATRGSKFLEPNKHHTTTLIAKVNHSLNHIISQQKRMREAAHKHTPYDLSRLSLLQNMDADFEDEFPIVSAVIEDWESLNAI